MSRFLTELDCHLKDCDSKKDDRIWVLNKSLYYYSSLLNEILEVPEDFETDLSSVPRVPIVYSIWGDRAHREGVLHDALFRKDFPGNISYNTANKIFLEAMKSRNKPIHIRCPMYAVVCVGSWPFYHKKNLMDKL